MGLKKFIVDWILPPAFLRIYNSRRKLNANPLGEDSSCSPWLRNYELRNMEALMGKRNKFKGEQCFILATGPSIKLQDLRILQGKSCIAVSMFHLHQDIDVIKPIWHVLAPTHPPFKFDTAKIIFDSLAERYRNNTEIDFLIGTTNYDYSYFNYLSESGVSFLKTFKNSPHFVEYGSSLELNESNFQNSDVWDLTRNPFTVRTVIYSAIQLAVFLGFQEIVLVGCDHDYLADIQRVENHHFYADSDAYSDRENLLAFDRERWFYEYYMRWRQFRLMRTYLAKMNIRIINATKGGMLDVFDRRELTECVSAAIRSNDISDVHV